MRLFTTLAAALALLAGSLSATTPISYVDYLYTNLDKELSKSSPNQTTVQNLFNQIYQNQTNALSVADTALGAVLAAQPVVIAGVGEIAALQLLGHNSLYLYNSQKATLGKGVGAYYTALKLNYTSQNILIGLFRYLNPKGVVSNWKNNVRPAIESAGLNAPTPNAPAQYNYDVLTLIDCYVQQIAGLNPNDPIQAFQIQALLTLIQAGQTLAAGFGPQGVSLVNQFAPILNANAAEQAQLAALGITSPVLQSVAAGLPSQRAINFYTNLSAIYTELNTYLTAYGFNNPQSFVDYFNSRRPDFIALVD